MKRELGQYFTTYNPFQNSGFLNWSKECDLSKTTILEPFAGSNNLINMLQDMGLCSDFKSFDIEPKNKFVKRRDTLKNFPKGFKVCITNPPYLAQNSAKRRNLEFPNIIYDDLYKYSLEKCLENCDYVGAIIPASFFNANIFRERLSHYILLNSKMFNDTEHPNTIEPSIKFVNGEEISPERIRVSSRSITRIMIPTKYKINNIIEKLNYNLNIFRKETYDLFLTPFKGLRKDNYYRRRLDYKLAKKLIEETLYGL